MAHGLLQALCTIMARKKIILIAGVALALVLAGSMAVWFFAPQWLPDGFRPGAATDDTQAKTAEQEKHREPEVGADLDVFVVNLAGPAPGRYLRTTLSLGVKSEHEKEEIKEFSGPIRHAVIMFLTEKQVEDLLDPAGKNRVRVELQKKINAAVGKKIVSNVYFKEFLIQ